MRVLMRAACVGCGCGPTMNVILNLSMRVRVRVRAAGAGENIIENISIAGACCGGGRSMNLPLEIYEEHPSITFPSPLISF